jgi:phenylpropionate dioxygenase-like ring-hydroxylating dioxygenase large terminal subunit
MSAVATAPATPRLRVLEGLHLGLPNYWYPILNAADLAAQPRGVRCFGQDLVVWRDSAGRPVVLHDRCAHRAARLSAGAREPGRVEGDTITCWYHGWAYDRGGNCVATPGEPPPGRERLRIQAYPAEERAGLIWMYLGEHAPPLQVLHELEDPAWCMFRTQVTWPTSWLNVLDNLADPMHQYYLHGRGYTTKRRPPFNRVRIADETDESLRIVQYLANPDGTVALEEPFGFEMMLPGTMRLELLNAAPGGDVRTIMIMTPVDADTVWVNFFRGRQATGLARLQWQAIWHLIYRRAVYRIMAQDQELLSTMGPLSETRSHEHMTPGDIGVIRWRRLMHRAFDRAQRAPEPSPETPSPYGRGSG